MKKILTAITLLTSTASFSETAVLCEMASSVAKIAEAVETLNGKLRDPENFTYARSWNANKKEFERRVILVKKLKKISAPSMTDFEGNLIICLTVSDE